MEKDKRALELVKYIEIGSDIDRSIIMMMDRYLDPQLARELKEELCNLTEPARKGLLGLLISIRTTSEAWGQKNPLPPIGGLLSVAIAKQKPNNQKNKGKRTWMRK